MINRFLHSHPQTEHQYSLQNVGQVIIDKKDWETACLLLKGYDPDNACLTIEVRPEEYQLIVIGDPTKFTVTAEFIKALETKGFELPEDFELPQPNDVNILGGFTELEKVAITNIYIAIMNTAPGSYEDIMDKAIILYQHLK